MVKLLAMMVGVLFTIPAMAQNTGTQTDKPLADKDRPMERGSASHQTWGQSTAKGATTEKSDTK